MGSGRIIGSLNLDATKGREGTCGQGGKGTWGTHKRPGGHDGMVRFKKGQATL